jgi:hypothetical protein
VLDILRRNWSGEALFQAKDVVSRIFHGAGNASFNAALAEERAAEEASFKAALELASGKAVGVISAPAINWKLQALVDSPALVEGKALVLRYRKSDDSGRSGGFKVVELLPALDPL